MKLNEKLLWLKTKDVFRAYICEETCGVPTSMLVVATGKNLTPH